MRGGRSSLANKSNEPDSIMFIQGVIQDGNIKVKLLHNLPGLVPGFCGHSFVPSTFEQEGSTLPERGFGTHHK